MISRPLDSRYVFHAEGLDFPAAIRRGALQESSERRLAAQECGEGADPSCARRAAGRDRRPPDVGATRMNRGCCKVLFHSYREMTRKHSCLQEVEPAIACARAVEAYKSSSW